MAEKQLRIFSDREENVTRSKSVIYSVHSGFFFVNLCYISIVQPHAAMHFCVCLLSVDEVLVSCHKPLQKPTLPFPDFASFVTWVELMFWCSTTLVFCFVYLRDFEHIITHFHNTFPYLVLKICHNARTDKTLA